MFHDTQLTTVALDVKIKKCLARLQPLRSGSSLVSAEDLARIISQYQIFTQNETLPSEFDVELNIRPGDLAGSVTAEMLGGWYGDPSDLDGIVQPLLDTIPIRPNVTVTGGTWIESLVELAGGSLNTTLRGTSNTFYVKVRRRVL